MTSKHILNSVLRALLCCVSRVNGYVLYGLLLGNLLFAVFLGTAIVMLFLREWLLAVIVVALYFLLLAITLTIDRLSVRYKIDC